MTGKHAATYRSALYGLTQALADLRGLESQVHSEFGRIADEVQDLILHVKEVKESLDRYETAH